MRTSFASVLIIVLSSACGGDDAAPDAASDASVDAIIDTSVTLDSAPGDTGTMGDATASDGAADAVVDAGPPVSSGCVDGAGLDEGERTFMLDGLMRRYILRLPNGYTRDRAWPLVLALHGNGGSASYWDGTSGSRNIRGVLQDDAILIIAEAISRTMARLLDGFEHLAAAHRDGARLLRRGALAGARGPLHRPSSIFSMGFSGGGSFSGVLGCRRTDIRAIAVGGSVIYFDEADCVGYPAAWITIGEMELTSGREAYRDWFRDRGGCSDTTMPSGPRSALRGLRRLQSRHAGALLPAPGRSHLARLRQRRDVGLLLALRGLSGPLQPTSRISPR